MFTGIIRATGRVSAANTTPDGRLRLLIDPLGWAHRPAAGDSIAVDGCCLTIVSDPPPQGPWAFDVVPESLAKTTLGRLAVGSTVHLEHAASASTLLDGHVVQGHVEGVGEVRAVRTEGEWRVTIGAPRELMPCITPKGSIAVEGVSLTIAAADVSAGTFDVALIPTTLEVTTLGGLRPGSRVNLETDILARTIVHYLRNFTGR